MDQRIADGLAAGRAQCRAGKSAAAIATWKEALRVAYETQNHAAAFVLSKNLGDVMLETSDQTINEAIGFFDYALQLLDQCGLHDEYAYYPPLENVVQYIRRRRRRATRMMEAPRRLKKGKKAELATEEQGALKDRVAIDELQLCTTCEQPGNRKNPMVVDEADGCPYCKSCFDAYYAAADEEDAAGSSSIDPNDRPPVEDEGLSAQEKYMGGIVASGSIQEEELSTPSDVAGIENSAKPEHVASSDPGVAVSETFISPLFTPLDRSEDSEFVSATLGSLADTTETSQLHLDPSPNGSVEDEVVTPMVSHAEDDTTPSTEETTLVYTIHKLKQLRPLDLPCPAEVVSSPVSLTNVSTATHDNRPSSSNAKKSNAKSAKRPNATLSRARTDTAEDAQAPPRASLLPSLAECEAVRDQLTALPTPLELASALFDSVPEDSAADTASASFSTQLQVFSSAC